MINDKEMPMGLLGKTSPHTSSHRAKKKISGWIEPRVYFGWVNAVKYNTVFL